MMRIEDAVKIIKCDGKGYTEAMVAEARVMAVGALEKQAKEDERLKPRKPERVNWVWNEFQCPCCHEMYGDDNSIVSAIKFCPHCGQVIDWKGVV